MKVFMSWAGPRSHAVAELLAWWTKCVIQASRPWISSEDVDRGSLWFTEINNNLSDTSVGIVCLTDENKERPWVLFEAGALAKGLSNSRVCTFLIDLEPKDIKDPLAQFNHTLPMQEDMKKLARTLNAALGPNALDTNVLSDVCDVYWPKFKERFDKVLKDHPPAAPKIARPDDDVLGEILESVRGMNQRIRKLETGPYVPPTWDSAGASVEEESKDVVFLREFVLNEYQNGKSPEEFISNLESSWGPNIRGTIEGILREIITEHYAIRYTSSENTKKRILRSSATGNPIRNVAAHSVKKST
jgi:hypothetical protein